MNSTYNKIVEMQCFASYSLEQIRDYVNEMLILAFGEKSTTLDNGKKKWRLHIEIMDINPHENAPTIWNRNNIVVSYTNNVDGTVSRYQMLSPRDLLKVDQNEIEWVDMVRYADATIDHLHGYGDFQKYGSPNYVYSYLPYEVGVPNKNVVKIIIGRSGYKETYKLMTYDEIVVWNEKNGISEVERIQADHYVCMKHHLSDEWAEKYAQGIKEEQETYMKLQTVKEERKELTATVENLETGEKYTLTDEQYQHELKSQAEDEARHIWDNTEEINL